MSEDQTERLRPHFSTGMPRINDRRVLSGVSFINPDGFRWRDAPRQYDPHKTFYNRGKR